MKTIIFFILLVIIVSSEPVIHNKELEDLLESIDYSTIETVWNFVKQYVDKAINFLKEIGLYGPLIDIIKEYGKIYGLQYCTSLKIPESICTSIIDFLLEYIK